MTDFKSNLGDVLGTFGLSMGVYAFYLALCCKKKDVKVAQELYSQSVYLNYLSRQSENVK